jgi:hypothetical protein
MRKLLIPGEQVLLRIGQHRGRALWICLLALGFALLAPLTAGISLLMSIALVAKLFETTRVLTNYRVIERRSGLFGRKLQEIALRDIQAVEINRSPFRWGTIRIFANSGRKVALDYVDGPERVKRAIDQARLTTP